MQLRDLLPHRDARDRRTGDFDSHDDVETTAGEWMLAAVAAMLAGVLARNAIKAGWRAARNEEPPTNPASSEVAWIDALTWAAATGAAVGMMRIVGRRSATAAWRRLR